MIPTGLAKKICGLYVFRSSHLVSTSVSQPLAALTRERATGITPYHHYACHPCTYLHELGSPKYSSVLQTQHSCEHSSNISASHVLKSAKHLHQVWQAGFHACRPNAVHGKDQSIPCPLIPYHAYAARVWVHKEAS